MILCILCTDLAFSTMCVDVCEPCQQSHLNCGSGFKSLVIAGIITLIFISFWWKKLLVFFLIGSGKTHIIVYFVRNRKPMHCHKFANPKISNLLIIWSDLDKNIFLFATKNYLGDSFWFPVFFKHKIGIY